MPAVLLLVFVVVPLIELYVILQVSELIGGWWTIAGLLAVSVAGAALVKREGLRAWARFREALGTARLPTHEVTDGALVLLAGALLLTPGFVTDAVGLLLLLPPSRAVVSGLLRSRVRTSVGLDGFGFGSTRPPRARRRPEEDLEIDVIDVRRTDPPPDDTSPALGPDGR
jgi:UPF0716 protein FxsA